MHAGDVAEEEEIGKLFNDPKHPYTQGLMKAIPSAVESLVDNESLYNIPGAVPTLLELPEGCRFQDRCHFVTSECRRNVPKLVIQKQHGVRCLHI